MPTSTIDCFPRQQGSQRLRISTSRFPRSMSVVCAACLVWVLPGCGTNKFQQELKIEEAQEVLESGAPQEKAKVLAEKIIEKVVVKEIVRSHREKMPERRKGYTQKANVGGHKVLSLIHI